MILYFQYFYAYAAKVQSSRRFIKCFEKETPNFLSIPSCKFLIMISRLHVIYGYILGAIFKTIISIYAQDMLSPLPSLEEILICNQATSVEEVNVSSILSLNC